MLLHDEKGLEHIGVPIKFADEPGRPDFSVAEKGEHNGEILRWLGYGRDHVAAIRARAGLTESSPEDKTI